MDDKILLICATGRSGSTSMQRIINTIPNSNICGENFGAINSLLEFYRRIKESSTTKIPGRFRPASYENILEQNIKFDRHCALLKSITFVLSEYCSRGQSFSQFLRDNCQQENELWNFQNKVRLPVFSLLIDTLIRTLWPNYR